MLNRHGASERGCKRVSMIDETGARWTPGTRTRIKMGAGQQGLLDEFGHWHNRSLGSRVDGAKLRLPESVFDDWD